MPYPQLLDQDIHRFTTLNRRQAEEPEKERKSLTKSRACLICQSGLSSASSRAEKDSSSRHVDRINFFTQPVKTECAFN